MGDNIVMTKRRVVFWSRVWYTYDGGYTMSSEREAIVKAALEYGRTVHAYHEVVDKMGDEPDFSSKEYVEAADVMDNAHNELLKLAMGYKDNGQ